LAVTGVYEARGSLRDGSSRASGKKAGSNGTVTDEVIDSLKSLLLKALLLGAGGVHVLSSLASHLLPGLHGNVTTNVHRLPTS
jgi:hypothetical protein